MKTIKYTALAVIAATMLFMSSCDKAKVDVNFDLSVSNIYFAVDTTSATGNLTFATTQFTSTLDAKLKDNDASIDDVESISLTNAEFIMIDPGAQNFDIVDKAYAYVSAGSLSELLIASKDPVPNGVTQFSLDAEGGNLKDYLKQTTVSFRAGGFTNAPNLVRDSIQAKLTFNVKASVKP
jgi:hypothetical protein